jgi:low-affinity inorganic phosphate transporter
MLATFISDQSLLLLFLAVGVACLFEFINGFHDTANSVATVIYTRSLRPSQAVLWSALCNFIGVFAGGISVAMGIVKLLPMDLIASGNTALTLITVFSMLIASCVWNFATWYIGLPASSSHALIGGLIGVGVGNALSQGMPASSGVNWTKTMEIGGSLLVSPLLGFGIAALALYLLSRKVDIRASAEDHNSPPPFFTRLALIGSSTGVSLAHGSNDGQKGVGLIMLILITVMPAQFALSTDALNRNSEPTRVALESMESKLLKHIAEGPKNGASLVPVAHATDGVVPDSAKTSIHLARIIRESLAGASSPDQLQAEQKLALRKQIYSLESEFKKLEKQGYALESLQPLRKNLLGLVEYSPLWVLVLVALSLGLGTTVGWKRVVETLGEKIGSGKMTYAQGAVSQSVAMGMIGASSLVGVPVSTTHCLSSGIAGTMVASGYQIQKSMVRSIGLAWVLTFPVTLALSCGLFLLLRSLTGV